MIADPDMIPDRNSPAMVKERTNRTKQKVKAKIYLLKKLIMESGMELKDREACRKGVVDEFTNMEVRHLPFGSGR